MIARCIVFTHLNNEFKKIKPIKLTSACHGCKERLMIYILSNHHRHCVFLEVIMDQIMHDWNEISLNIIQTHYMYIFIQTQLIIQIVCSCILPFLGLHIKM